MKMTLKLTEKDKKLLALLVVVLLTAGLGGQVILPLMNKNTELKNELEAAKLEKMQREIKVSGLLNMRNARDASKERLAEASTAYTGIVRSKEIDKILTELALDHGLNVMGLSISMPGDVQTTLLDYSLMLKNAATEDSIRSYAGFRTVAVTMRMSGSREALQAMLDTLYRKEPFCRVTAFRWETSRADGEVLSVNLEIYMMQTAEEYGLPKQPTEEQSAEEQPA